MIRPREGGFCYSPGEFEVMLEDTAALGEAGAAGIAFGILRPDGTVDGERCGKLIEAAGPMETVFHRAFDVVPDWRAAMDSLCGLGVLRILTSGQAPSAESGSALIRRMREYAAGRIGILPGGGIGLHNVQSLVEKTGCKEIHVSMKKACSDPSCAANPGIHFGSPLYLPEDRYQQADGQALGKLVNLLKT
jgi:copper homeostasis protein